MNDGFENKGFSSGFTQTSVGSIPIIVSALPIITILGILIMGSYW